MGTSVSWLQAVSARLGLGSAWLLVIQGKLEIGTFV